MMTDTTGGRHRLGTPGLVPVRSLVRVRSRVFGWFGRGRHRGPVTITGPGLRLTPNPV